MADDASSGFIGRFFALFTGRESSLRDQIADAIDDAEGEAVGEGDLALIEREMVRNLLSFGARNAGDVAVPRSDIIAVPESMKFDALVAAFADAGHSRLPVYRESLDEVIGMIHVKDVFGILAGDTKPPKAIASLMRQPLFVPQSMGVLDLLAQMRANQTHLAIVIDEYSGTDGLITIEDLVERIVGDIADEHDDAPVAQIMALENGAWEADARTSLETAAREIASALGEVDEDVDTLGGLAFVLAGHVPQPGERLAHPSGWMIEITQGDDRRATRLRLHPPRAAKEQPEATL
jgi:CBS domain containing-hemolysin-like protein